LQQAVEQWAGGGHRVIHVSRLSDWIGRATVRCEPRDRYGRTVASCFKGAEDLNRWMVANGWAVAHRKYSLDYVADEERAHRARLPLQRVDLLKANHYMFGSMQISRGCPFTCEFCDIIVTFGRRPRVKTSEQVLAELESFRRIGLNTRRIKRLSTSVYDPPPWEMLLPGTLGER
jgi:hypothetical protein